MCGICGKIDLTGKEVDRQLLADMAAALSHRGPDDEGFYVHQAAHVSCGLGHRRLSIIDLSQAGRQPMSNEDGTLWLVFNGEIYNFPALRRELEARGHRFSSRTDSEVILHLFEEEGPASFGRLQGMFALALWSEKAETLLLARDPVGIKPLVYFWDARRLLFASEIKSLLADPAVTRGIDLEALDLYLSLNYIPTPWTIFKNIRKLRPGHFVKVQGGSLVEERYWEVPAPAAGCNDLGEIKSSLYRAVEEAVRGHMIADVPLGAFLSGGIDSSVVVGLMARNSTRPVKTFSIGYSDMPMFDERPYARQVAAFHGTDHCEIVLSSREITGTIPEVLASLDEPFGDSSAVPTFVVARKTAGEVKVALSGDGGDELFAGYRLYRAESWHGLYLLLPRLIRKGLLEPFILDLPDSRDTPLAERLRRLKKFVRSARETFPERVFALNELFSSEAKEALLEEAFRSPQEAGPSLFAAALALPASDPVNRMLLADLLISLPADMLWKVDMMSMRHSLEVRVPLLDRQVCEQGFRISGDWKIRRGRGKYVFIETFRDLLPPALHNRPKWGFEMPVSRWLKTDLGPLIDDYLDAGRLARQGIFRPAAVAALVADLRMSRRDTSWQIWNLIAFQAWYEATMH